MNISQRGSTSGLWKRLNRKRFGFYFRNGKAQDADIHNPILEAGNLDNARKVSRQVALRLGLTDAEVDRLFSD